MGMNAPEQTKPLSVTVRKWAIRLGIAALAVEVTYLIAGNVLLRTGLLTDLINKKPEKTKITWDSAVTYLPGVATVSNFELRSQTANNQISLRVAEARTSAEFQVNRHACDLPVRIRRSSRRPRYFMRSAVSTA